MLRRRIARQFLGATRAPDAVAVARRLGGIHAQVASSAAAATALRTDSPGLDGLVRTWAARGTLHHLPAGDLPVWVAAMSTRTRETTGSWLKYHGVTAAQMQDIIRVTPQVLGAEPLTREELADRIIAATGHSDLREPLVQGFGAILKPLAFRGLLISGPPRGRNVTFVSPGALELPPVEDAIDTLALAYLGAYGPADAAEFARWFDLKPPLAKKSFARIADRLDDDGIPAGLAGEPLTDTVHLLPAFDPYVVGSLRQLDQVSTGPRSAVSRPQGWISPTLVVDGRIEGVWREVDGVPHVEPFGALPARVRRALPPGTVVS